MLQSKVQMPPLNIQTIRRTELIAKCSDLAIGINGFDKKTTLLIAPAGYGKTVFLQDWLSKQPHRVIWCTLSESNEEAYEALKTLVMAVKFVFPEICTSAFALLEEMIIIRNDEDKIMQVANQIINEMMSVEEPVYFVFDDYHVIKKTQTHLLFAHIIEQMSPMIHVIIADRFVPPFPVLKWQAKNMVRCISAEDFKFSFNETECFVKQIYRANFTSEQMELLYEKSEGWITAVILFLIGIEQTAGNLNIEAYLAGIQGNQEQILSYITSEFFDHLDEPVQQLIIKSSVFEEFSEDMLIKILNSEEVIKSLRLLKKHQLFIVELDNEGKRFRYHYLMKSLLDQKFKNLSSDEIVNIRKKAVVYFLENKMYSQALEQTYKVGITTQVAQIMDEYCNQILESGGALTLVEGLKRIDDATFDKFPMLKLVRIFLHLVVYGKGDLHEDLEEAELFYYEDEKKNILYKGVYNVVKCLTLIYENRLEDAYKHADTALELLPDEPYFWRMSVAVMCGDVMVFSGLPNKGYYYYLQAHNSNIAGRHHFFTMSTGIKAAYALHNMGSLNDMGKILDDMLMLAKEKGYEKTSKAGATWAYYGLFLFEKGDMEAAKRSIERGKRLAKSEPLFYAWTLLVNVEILVEEGDYKGALMLIQELQSYDRNSNLNHLIKFETAAYKAFVLAKLGLQSEAFDNFNEIGIDLEDSITPDKIKGYLLKLEIAVDHGNLAQKTFFEIFEKLEKIFKRGDCGHSEIKLNMIILAFMEKNNCKDISQQRLKIKQLLEEKGYSRLEKTIFGESKTVFLADSDMVYIEKLSSREVEILMLIADGLSNKAIGERLFLSLSTVKWHTSNIYNKLGVKGRTQALATARKLSVI